MLSEGNFKVGLRDCLLLSQTTFAAVWIFRIEKQ